MVLCLVRVFVLEVLGVISRVAHLRPSRHVYPVPVLLEVGLVALDGAEDGGLLEHVDALFAEHHLLPVHVGVLVVERGAVRTGRAGVLSVVRFLYIELISLSLQMIIYTHRSKRECV